MVKTQGFLWAAHTCVPLPLSHPTSVAKPRGTEGGTEPALGSGPEGTEQCKDLPLFTLKGLSTPGPLQGLAPLPVASTHL